MAKMGAFVGPKHLVTRAHLGPMASRAWAGAHAARDTASFGRLHPPLPLRRLGAPTLRDACIQFVLSEHKNEVIEHPAFQQEFQSYPNLLIPIIKAAPSLSASPPAKRQRIEAPVTHQFEDQGGAP